MPSSLSWRMRLRTWAVSAGPRAAVGSSMIRILALKWTARAIATACRWPPDSDLTGVVKFVKFGLSRPMTLRVASSIAPSSSVPQRVVISRPRNMLAGRVDVVGQGEGLVDRLDVELLGVARVRDRRGSPSIRISPESAGWAPDSTRIRVDLPAPLPPTRPMTSPA